MASNNQQLGITKSGVTFNDGKIEGYAVVFYRGMPEQEYKLGGNTFERVSPDCEITFADDVFCTFDHDRQNYIARSSNNTLSLTIDQKGVKYVADVPDTTAGRDLTALAKRPGDIAGSSFEFFIGDNESSYKLSRDGEKIIKWLTSLKIHAVNPVFKPAYTASVRQRSDELLQKDIERFEATEKMLEIISQYK